MAKLLAEQTNQNTKLQHRIEYLEAQLGKYENLQLRRDDSGNIVYFEKSVYPELQSPSTNPDVLGDEDEEGGDD